LAEWNELKKDDYFKEIIEVLEDSELLANTKLNSKVSVDFNDYINERYINENICENNCENN
jgi:hypothetical protein